MGRPPAYIFVVRHGNRLDAADKQWHLTSPTPYDPPLTYGGWVHSRTVGARITAILRDEAERPPIESSSKSTSGAQPSSSPSHPRKRRRFRVIIHTSPFLRCVQTSIAISAGLAASNPALSSTTTLVAPLDLPHGRYFIRAPLVLTAPPPTPDKPHRNHFEKTVLRVDPFLGEWLSPDYYEHITPPPKSALMLATARAELLRRSSYDDYPHYHAHIYSTTSNQLWNGSSSLSTALLSPTLHGPRNSSLETMSRMAESLPGQGGSSGHADLEGTHAPGYVFPVPSYALSTIEPIPKGYVAHARDACVKVDYHWDSSRDHFSWGDGGTLPEEWASMHQRFRRGLAKLVDWYSSTESPSEPVVGRTKTYGSQEAASANNDEEYEIEDVVVLVSHAAGCNALVGAITQQPVLADIAMSSLTMAKRRAGFEKHISSAVSEEVAATIDTVQPRSLAVMPEIYELKMFANTEHLIIPTYPAFNRPPPSVLPDAQNRFDSGFTSGLKDTNTGPLHGSTNANGQTTWTNASLGSIRKPSGGPSMISASSNSALVTVGSEVSSFSPTRPERSASGTWGLWSPRLQVDDPIKEPEGLHVQDASSTREGGANNRRENEGVQTAVESRAKESAVEDSKQIQKQDTEEAHEEEHDYFDMNAGPRLWAGTGTGGLWGAPTPLREAEVLRDFSSHKRRWTVTER
ncbi:hypothetical protein GGS20DRAFT_582453 [Poronia punctata]|nr:hypothetical protein GGS20DRAFT_582453 [Poronia punctata]